MKIIVIAIATIAMFVAAGAVGQDQADRPNVSVDPTRGGHSAVNEGKTDKLPLYAKLVGGVWDSHAEWKRQGGTGHAPLHARVSYHWMAGGTVIHAVSNVVTNAGEEKLAYDTIVYYHPGEKDVKFLSFGTGGNLFEGTSTFSGDAVEHRWASHEQNGSTNYKETITLTDPDHYRWVVFREEAGQWQQIMDSVYTREK